VGCHSPRARSRRSPGTSRQRTARVCRWTVPIPPGVLGRHHGGARAAEPAWAFRTAAHHSGAAARFWTGPATRAGVLRRARLPDTFVCDGSVLRSGGVANSGLTLAACVIGSPSCWRPPTIRLRGRRRELAAQGHRAEDPQRRPGRRAAEHHAAAACRRTGSPEQNMSMKVSGRLVVVRPTSRAGHVAGRTRYLNRNRMVPDAARVLPARGGEQRRELRSEPAPRRRVDGAPVAAPREPPPGRCPGSRGTARDGSRTLRRQAPSGTRISGACRCDPDRPSRRQR
jgi:hypothetical protein